MSQQLRVRKCCVLNYKDEKSRRHRFPVNDFLFDIWVKRIFPNVSGKQISKSSLVCESHFTPIIIQKERKILLKGSVPTLNIPGNYI